MTSNAQRLGHPAAHDMTPFADRATEVKIVVSDCGDGCKRIEVCDAAGQAFGCKSYSEQDSAFFGPYSYYLDDLVRDAGIFVVDFLNGKPVIEGYDSPGVQGMLDKFWADGGSKHMGRAKAA